MGLDVMVRKECPVGREGGRNGDSSIFTLAGSMKGFVLLT